jgi:hypothetical protein
MEQYRPARQGDVVVNEYSGEAISHIAVIGNNSKMLQTVVQFCGVDGLQLEVKGGDFLTWEGWLTRGREVLLPGAWDNPLRRDGAAFCRCDGQS